MTELLWDTPAGYDATLVLAHGAGAAMDSPWMNEIAALVAARDIRVVRFEFEYMAARREGRRRPAPKAEASMAEYRAVVEQVGGNGVFIGGKSYGGRVASLVADELHDAGMIRGLVCLGFPFHPPGKPENLRTAHLAGIRTPTLICQGVRDPFGTQAEVAGYDLSPAITIEWFDGAHELLPLKSAGIARPLERPAGAIAGFVSR